MARRRRRAGPKTAKPSAGTTLVGNHRNAPRSGFHRESHQQGQSEDALARARDLLTTLASKPEDFYKTNEAVAKELTGALRDLFAIARQSEVQSRSYGPLEELYVDGLDCESIWAELELRNAALERHTRRTVARLLQSERVSLAADINPAGDATEVQSGLSDGISEGVDDADFELDEEDREDEDEDEAGEQNGRDHGQRPRGGKGGTKSEDVFFDADDMERFADEGTLEDDLGDGVLDEMYGKGGMQARPDEASGMESDSNSDEEDDAEMEDMLLDKDQGVGGGISYKDFFGQDKWSPKGNGFGGDGDSDADEEVHRGSSRGSRLEAGNDEGGEHGERAQTPHEVFSRHVESKISDQERELVAKKPWELRGEVQAKDRPQNSLLEATVDVDRATRAAPLPTPERAMNLLDMIKKRCLDGKWDDVTPKNLEVPPVRKEAPQLSQEKSREGLGDLYEKEFLKKTMGVEENDPQAAFKTELKQLFTKLCGKLDALCNFHYTPKAIIPEMKVQADVAAIAMEDVLPSSVADAEALAPEEVYAKKRGRDAEFLEADDMSQADRKRVRSSKKAARRKARRQVEAEQKLVSKLNPGLGNKYEKSKMLRDIQSAKIVTSSTGDEGSTGREFSTSSKFFTKLQKTVKETVVSAGQSAAREKGGEGRGRQAAGFRL